MYGLFFDIRGCEAEGVGKEYFTFSSVTAAKNFIKQTYQTRWNFEEKHNEKYDYYQWVNNEECVKIIVRKIKIDPEPKFSHWYFGN